MIQILQTKCKFSDFSYCTLKFAALLLGRSHPKVTEIPRQTRNESSMTLGIKRNENFSMIKKVVTVKKFGGIYTPRPSTTITVLPIFTCLTSSLLRTSSSLSQTDPSTITFLPVSSRLISSLSEVLLSLFVRLRAWVTCTARLSAHNLRALGLLCPSGCIEGSQNLWIEQPISMSALDLGSKVLVVLKSRSPVVDDLCTPSKVRYLPNCTRANPKWSARVRSGGRAQLLAGSRPSGTFLPEVVVPNSYNCDNTLI